jgi:hypothetical protein
MEDKALQRNLQNVGVKKSMEKALEVLKGFEIRKFSHIRNRNIVKWRKKGHVTNIFQLIFYHPIIVFFFNISYILIHLVCPSVSLGHGRELGTIGHGLGTDWARAG